MPVYKLTPIQYGIYLDYFKRHSLNERIGRQELRSIICSSGRNPTKTELQQIIDSISVDSAGISFQTFIDFVASYQELRDVNREYREAFRVFDTSGTGNISKEDVAKVFESMGTKIDVDELFKQVDSEGTGSIDYDMFVEMMKA